MKHTRSINKMKQIEMRMWDLYILEDVELNLAQSQSLVEN